MASDPTTLQDIENIAATSDNDNLLAMLLEAKKRFGRSPLSVVRDWWPLLRGSGKLSIHDYFRYGLYDTENFDKEARKKFVSDAIFWPIVDTINDLQWKATLEDKSILYSLLQQANFPTLETLAVIEKGNRIHPLQQQISTQEDLSELLSQPDCLPLFLKPVFGSGSSGTMRVEAFDGTNVLFKNREQCTLGHLFHTLIGDQPYLAQPVVQNHPALAEITDSLATIRIYNIRGRKGLETHYPMIKLPANGNIADNFWRDGNLLAAVDMQTGTIGRVIRSTGLFQEEFTHHPDSKTPISGLELPFWQDICQLNKHCAQLFDPVAFTSTDIAITATGPVVVEVNFAGSFTLPQILYREGFLTEERKALFQDLGWSF